MSAATTIANAFGENANLYTEVLALSASGPSVPHAHIRRAYYKRALLYHPDKQDPSKLSPEEIEDAKAKFQAVSVAYSILSNEESRAEYDESGELYDEDDDIGGSSGKSGTDAWAEYFSGIFGKVTVDDIDKFESQYKCSEEEERDVLKYYARFKGDLNKCLECVMCSREEDKKRWVDDYIVPAVGRGDVEEFKETIEKTMGGGAGGGEDDNEDMSEEDDEATETESDSDEEKKASPKNSTSSKKQKKHQQATKGKGKNPPKKKSSQAKAKKKGGGGGGADEDLIAAIRGNAVARSQRSFESMMAGLEERYGGGGKKKKMGDGGRKRKKKRQPDPDDIPDDEFERIRASLGSRK